MAALEGICIVLLSVHMQYAQVTGCTCVCTMCITITIASLVLLHVTLISSCCVCVHDCRRDCEKYFRSCVCVHVDEYKPPLKDTFTKRKRMFVSTNIKFYNLNVEGKERANTNENTRLNRFFLKLQLTLTKCFVMQLKICLNQ